MRVLVVGRDPRLLATVCALLRLEGFDVVGTTLDLDALAVLATESITAVVLGGGVEPLSRERLTRAAAALDVQVVGASVRDQDVTRYVRDLLAPRLRAALTQPATSQPAGSQPAGSLPMIGD